MDRVGGMNEETIADALRLWELGRVPYNPGPALTVHAVAGGVARGSRL